MSKNVTSKDPRKPAIVAALKRKSGGGKVTLLTELSNGNFMGHCLLKITLGRGSKWESLGAFEVSPAEVGL